MIIKAVELLAKRVHCVTRYDTFLLSLVRSSYMNAV